MEVPKLQLRQEIQQKINSLQCAKQLIDKEIAKLQKELVRLDAKQSDSQIAAPSGDRQRGDKFAQNKQTKRLAEYLRSVGYVIENCKTQTPDRSCYNIAKQIWNARIVAIPFCKALHQSGEKLLDYPIDGLSAAQKNLLLNLCRTMTKNEWITFTDQTNRLEVRPHVPKNRKTFLNGGWAEEVNRYLVKKIVTAYTPKLKHKIFWDVKLKEIQSGRSMQLDIAVQFQDRFYIIETKTEKMENKKMVERAKVFNRDGNRFLVCSTKLQEKTASPQSYLRCALDNLEAQLTKLFKQDFSVAK